MRYKWNVEEIRENIIQLELMKALENSLDNIENINNVLGIYTEMLDNYDNRIKEQDILYNLDYNISDLNVALEVLSYYYKSINPEIIKILIGSYKPFYEIYYQQKKDEGLVDPILTSTNDDLKKITENFFIEMTPAEIAEKAIKILNKEGLIHINHSKNSCNYDAITLLDCILNKKYIYLLRNNRLTELRALPHEMFHYVFSDFDDYKSQYSNMYFVNETEGSFANILFGDYFYQNNDQFGNFFNQLNLLTYESNVIDLIVRDAVVTTLRDNNKIRLNNVNKIISNYNLTSFNDENEILEYISNSHESLIKYTLSFLIAIDLYYIYLEDKELAFYLLKNIRYIKSENDIFKVLRNNHITFMDDGYKNLKEYTKKIERQN